jgi:hypothetical protein
MKSPVIHREVPQFADFTVSPRSIGEREGVAQVGRLLSGLRLKKCVRHALARPRANGRSSDNRSNAWKLA